MVAAGQQLGDADDGTRRREQAVDPHPLVVVQLREVVPAAVGQQDDDHLAGPLPGGGQVADDLEGGNERRST